MLASYDEASDRLTLRLSSQMPSGARDTLCNNVLGSPSQVRVVVDDVGGGFGMKTGLYPEDIIVAFAARAIERPVRWTAERLEEFLAAIQGRDVESRAELALDAEGKALGYRIRSLANMGAYAGNGGHHHSIVSRALGLDQHLRHQNDRSAIRRRAHQHGSDGRLSGRRVDPRRFI